ncbi:MAG: hypothetical protein K0Q84_2190 [Arthrobacter sp.]|nr:hypothetical protein [Arthrobacter sp.]
MRQELELAKAEAKQSATRAGKGGGMLAGAGVAGHFVLLFLSIALWYALGELMGLGWSAVVVALIWGIIAAVLASIGKKELKAIKGMPQTVETVQEIPPTLKPNGGIRADIEATRARLGTNVDAVADKVTPSNIVHRQTDKAKDKVRNAVTGVKEKVMGAADHATHSTSGGVHSATGSAGSALHDARSNVTSTLQDAGSTVSSTAQNLGSAVADAPHKAAAKTQGNPLAAGLIAFGAGLLVSSLIPPSQKEREAAEALKGAAEPVTTQLTEAAKDMGQDLKDQAQEAMENVKATATDAAAHVKDEGQTAVTDVKTSTSDAKDHVQNT